MKPRTAASLITVHACSTLPSCSEFALCFTHPLLMKAAHSIALFTSASVRPADCICAKAASARDVAMLLAHLRQRPFGYVYVRAGEPRQVEHFRHLQAQALLSEHACTRSNTHTTMLSYEMPAFAALFTAVHEA
jgi:hypothetical protein